MKLVCKDNKCTGCMSCVEECSQKAIEVVDNVQHLNAVINEELCVNCGQCFKRCQVNFPIKGKEPITWFQGWADDKIRFSSSSGGFATSIMKYFIDVDSYVCSCVFDQGEFLYRITNSLEDISSFKGSKYVKSNPGRVFRCIKELLRDGKRVLMIGLPCHIAGMKKYVGPELEEQLYSVDLICHGTPSVKLLYSFLKENKITIDNISDMSFRNKNKFTVSVDQRSIVPNGTIDAYTLCFLRGTFYTDNCYNCQYANTNRISDLTIGDSWGTELTQEENKGISLALCQTPKGNELLQNSHLVLKEVDVEKAIKANHQLNHPSLMPPERELFFRVYLNTGDFTKAVKKCYPVDVIKQRIKGKLIEAGVLKKNR